MYAIIKSGDKQYRVSPGQTIEVDHIHAKVGEQIAFDEVLMLGGDHLLVTPSELQGARVSAKVLAQTRSRKVVGLKYKPKKHYRRRVGQRADLTRLHITEIVVPQS